VQALRQACHVHVINAETAQLAFQLIAARGNVLVVILQLEPGARFGAGVRALQITQIRVQPIATWRALLGGEHLDLFAGLQFIGQRHDVAVNFCAAATVPDIGVNVVREVERCGAPAADR